MLTKLAAGLPDSTEKIPTIKEMPITQEVTGITNQIRFALNRSARPTHDFVHVPLPATAHHYGLSR